MRLRTRYLALLLLAVPALGAGDDNQQAAVARCNSCSEHCYSHLNDFHLEDTTLTALEQAQVLSLLDVAYISSFSELDSHLGQLPEILAGVSDAARQKFEDYSRIRCRQIRSMRCCVKTPGVRLCTACPLHCPVMAEQKCNSPGNHHAMEVYPICFSTFNGKRLTDKQLRCRCDRCGIQHNPRHASHDTCMVGCRGCDYDICMPCANSDDYHGSLLFQQEMAYREEMDDYAYGVPAMDMLGWIMEDATYKQHLASLPSADLAASIRQALDLYANPEESSDEFDGEGDEEDEYETSDEERDGDEST
jgi:hypothetical protein